MLSHPILPSNISWLDKHPNASQLVSNVAFPNATFALCLFGIPATVGNKAGMMRTDVHAIKHLSQSQLSVFNGTDVFFHAWTNDKRICNELKIRYIPKDYRCQKIVFDTRKDLFGYNHVQSMILSIVQVLRLAIQTPYDQVFLARHDLLLCSQEKIPLFTPSQFIVTDSWTHKNLDGIPDWSFIGSLATLQYVFQTLHERFKKGDKIHTNTRAHFMIQTHLDQINYTKQNQVRHYVVKQNLYRIGCGNLKLKTKS